MPAGPGWRLLASLPHRSPPLNGTRLPWREFRRASERAFSGAPDNEGSSVYRKAFNCMLKRDPLQYLVAVQRRLSPGGIARFHREEAGSSSPQRGDHRINGGVDRNEAQLCALDQVRQMLLAGTQVMESSKPPTTRACRRFAGVAGRLCCKTTPGVAHGASCLTS